jgi:hypothetical protein
MLLGFSPIWDVRRRYFGDAEGRIGDVRDHYRRVLGGIGRGFQFLLLGLMKGWAGTLWMFLLLPLSACFGRDFFGRERGLGDGFLINGGRGI